MNLERSETGRGFKLIKFKDRYDIECSLQESSLATEPAIWFGVNAPNAKIMAQHAAGAGIKTDAVTGWVDYPIPKEVLISTRMHLTQEQVQELLPVLTQFAHTGEIE